MTGLFRFISLGAIVALGLAASGAHAANYGYTLDTPRGAGLEIAPFATDGSIAEFFNLTDSGPNPSVTLKRDQALLFLHKDTTTGVIGFGMFIDRSRDGSGGRLGFDVSGAPTTAVFTVRDNDIEPGLTVNSEDYNFRWNKVGADGFATEGFEAAEWALLLDDFYTDGITRMAFLMGDGTRINIGKPGHGAITLTATDLGPLPGPSQVPLPASGLLLAAGGLALGAIRSFGRGETSRDHTS